MSRKPESHRWGFYAGVMVVGLLLSMAGNAAHAWSQWHTDVAAGIDRGAMSPWVPTVAITVVPAMVMVMTETVVISHRRNAGWARTVVTALAALVGIVALVVSYVGLVHVCTVIIGLPTALGYVAPVIVDAPIIAATIGLWDVQQTIRADRELSGMTNELVSEQRSVAPREPVEQRPTAPVEHAIEVVDRPDEQVDEQWSSDRATAPYEMDDRSVEISSTGSDQAGRVDEHPVDRADEILSDLPVRPDELVSEQWSTAPVDRPDELDDVASEQVSDLPARPDEQPDERGSTEPVEWLSEAERVRSATGITADPADLATVLRMDDAGASRREIAEAVGRPKSTVSGWIAKASSVGADRPALTAVR